MPLVESRNCHDENKRCDEPASSERGDAAVNEHSRGKSSEDGVFGQMRKLADKPLVEIESFGGCARKKKF